jgi:DNA-binding GntR family transcriptional regulator
MTNIFEAIKKGDAEDSRSAASEHVEKACAAAKTVYFENA